MDLSKVLAGREVQLLNQEQSRFTQLTRLTQDFDLCIFEALIEAGAKGRHCKSFALVTARHQQTEQRALTPSFSSLIELEQHLADNFTKILDEYLFDQVMADIDQPEPTPLPALA